MAPSVEESTKRYQTLCDQMQDSIHMIQQNMTEGFTFQPTEAINGLQLVDTNFAVSAVTTYINVLSEYVKLVKFERRRRELFKSIETKVNDGNERAKLKIRRRVSRIMLPFYKARERPEISVVNEFEELTSAQQEMGQQTNQIVGELPGCSTNDQTEG